MIEKNQILLADCMDIMAEMPDNYIDLAVVDPEYGINIANNSFRQKHKKKNWDNKIPNDSYFKELFRISKNQIIWGGNYFDLPKTQGFLIWDKNQPFDFSSSMCEFAWMSFQSPAKIFYYRVTKEKNKIHPTQKPVALYRWILQNYAKPGQLIFDSHSGSGSLACGCHLEKFDFIACELDEDYHRDSVNRLTDLRSQGIFNYEY